ncbi:DDE superfamily endonuclease domain-containing protein [Ditylenchus destructor]|nr:DDE superfamily endonuclease domain-containing protein [Ditylenchus destructor]
MTPFGAPNTPARARYNRALCRNRVLVEQVIGRWKRRFHALHGELRISLDRVPQFIMAAAVLHNICKMRNEPDVDDEEFDEVQDMYDGTPSFSGLTTGAETSIFTSPTSTKYSESKIKQESLHELQRKVLVEQLAFYQQGGQVLAQLSDVLDQFAATLPMIKPNSDFRDIEDLANKSETESKQGNEENMFMTL